MPGGRPPKPTALKRLAGNPGRRPLPKNEPKPKAKLPYCPRHLEGEASLEWRRMARALFDLGLLTEIDRAALAAYCQAWARWVEAEKKIAEEGMVITTEKGNIIQSPYVGIANKAMEMMHRFLVQFGMTPAARTKVAVMEAEQLTLAELLFEEATK